MRRLFVLSLATSLGLGCVASPPPFPEATPRAPRSSAPTGAKPAFAPDVFRMVGPDARAASLVGRVRLLATGAGLLSDKGAGLVSENGLGIVSNNGSTLVGKTRYALAQAAVLAEANLADAVVEVLDASGRVLTDAAGKPVAATSDAEGRYRLEAALPNEALVLRVRLFPQGGAPAAGGQLLALLSRDRLAAMALSAGAAAQAPPPLDLDTASTLGSAYVLDRFVAGQKDPRAVLDRLPGAEADALRADFDDARAGLLADQGFGRDALVAAAERLRSAVPAVAQRLARIRAILLLGQAELGEGLAATSVSLAQPIAVAADGQGGFYVAEVLGRVRHVGADGRIRLHGSIAGTGRLAGQPSLGRLGAMVALPDGALAISDGLAQIVWRLPADGAAVALLGSGKREQGALATTGPQTAVMGPHALALGADGALYVGEMPRSAKLTGRVLRLAVDEGVTQLDGLTGGVTVAIAGLAQAPDGALWVLNGEGPDRWLRRRDPAGAWAQVALVADASVESRLLALPDGSVLLSEPNAHRIARYTPAGARTVAAGSGQAGQAPEGAFAAQAALDDPTGLALAPDGDVWFTEPGAGLVRRLRGFAGGQPTLQTVAGTRSAAQVGEAGAIALNVPGGLAFDDQGRLLVVETGGDTVKRLDGTTLTVVAGAGKGFAGDGGPAAQARLDGPTGLAYAKGVLFIVDSANERIRRVELYAQPPTITTVAGKGAMNGGKSGLRLPALDVTIPRPHAIVIGPDGLPYWSDTGQQTISRLTADGYVEVVAGTIGEKGQSGDGGPAKQARFTYPAGLAFDAAGDLYVADAGNSCVRKITQPAISAEPVITRVAGAVVGSEGGGLAGLIGSAGVPDPVADEGKLATDVALYLPVALAFDAQGRLHIAEGGTSQLQALGRLLAGPQADQLGALLGLLPPVSARIRRVDAAGKITTVVGPGGRALTAASGDDALALPVAIVFVADGGLVIADGGANQLKRVPRAAFSAP